jgi:N-methylhydantoinase B
MNNVTIGGWDPERGRQFAYYETVGGGAGASPELEGLSAVHTHMTNTMNTPAEALEMTYPFRLIEYAVRQRSGGAGKHRGGDGIVRTYETLALVSVTLLTERRKIAAWGLSGGEPGATGRNWVLRAGTEAPDSIPSKVQLRLEAGDRLTIETPGGGGWGEVQPP